MNLGNPLGLQAPPQFVTPQEIAHYQTPDGYLAEQAGVSSTQAYENGSDLNLSQVFAPTTSDYLALTATAFAATGDLPVAAAFGSLAAFQSVLSYQANPTSANAASTLIGVGLNAGTGGFSPLSGFLLNYTASDVAKAVVKSAMPQKSSCP